MHHLRLMPLLSITLVQFGNQYDLLPDGKKIL